MQIIDSEYLESMRIDEMEERISDLEYKVTQLLYEVEKLQSIINENEENPQ